MTSQKPTCVSGACSLIVEWNITQETRRFLKKKSTLTPKFYPRKTCMLIISGLFWMDSNIWIKNVTNIPVNPHSHCCVTWWYCKSKTNLKKWKQSMNVQNSLPSSTILKLLIKYNTQKLLALPILLQRNIRDFL